MEFAIGALILISMMAILGYRRGGIVSLIFMIVMAIGGLIVAALATAVFGSGATVIGAVVGVFGCGLVCSLQSEAVEAYVTQRVGEDMRQFDRVVGTLMSAVVGTAVIWLVAAVATLAPSESRLSESLRQSPVSDILLNAVPPTGHLATIILRSGLAPAVDGPTILVDFPSDDVMQQPAVVAARQSVLRIVGESCGGLAAGSGWVIAPRFVITNAHVVAGMQQPGVLLMGNPPLLLASVRAFDPVNDLAVLYVPLLGAAPLEFAQNTAHGDSTAVVGFPKEDGLSVTPARYDRELVYAIPDIYDQVRTERPVVVFRGSVRPGNSGSPMVDVNGKVVATIAAHALNQSIDGGFAVPNSSVRDLFGRMQSSVDTGPCVVAPKSEDAVPKK